VFEVPYGGDETELGKTLECVGIDKELTVDEGIEKTVIFESPTYDVDEDSER
jgi:hypothetical protein